MSETAFITEILSNGSHWMGEKEDPIESLLDSLEKYPLDRTFEKYGNFIQDDPEWIRAVPGPSGYLTRWEPTETPYPGHKVTRFWGNFLTVSHVFSIDTDDPKVIETLTKAIRANQTRKDYLSQPKPKTP